MSNKEFWLSQVGEGWHDLVIQTIDSIEALAMKDKCELEIREVKEEDGLLQIKFKSGIISDDTLIALLKIIQIAKEKSASICEYCGAPGKLKTHHTWLKTLCEECSNTRDSSWHGLGWNKNTITLYLRRCERIAHNAQEGNLPTPYQLRRALKETEELHEKQLLNPDLYKIIKDHLREIKEQMAL